MKKRVAQFMLSTECDVCHGKRLKPESLSVKFAGMDIAEIARAAVEAAERGACPVRGDGRHGACGRHPEKTEVDAAHCGRT